MPSNPLQFFKRDNKIMDKGESTGIINGGDFHQGLRHQTPSDFQ